MSPGEFVSFAVPYQPSWPYGCGSTDHHTPPLWSFMGINDIKTNSFWGADKIPFVTHLLQCPKLFFLQLSLQKWVSFSLQSYAEWGHGIGNGSICHRGEGQGEWMLFVSDVSKPPTVFFLLINLLTLLYCVHFKGKVEGECAAGGEKRWQLAGWGLIMFCLIFCTHLCTHMHTYLYGCAGTSKESAFFTDLCQYITFIFYSRWVPFCPIPHHHMMGNPDERGD